MSDAIKYKILIVDDDQQLNSLLATTLSGADYEVTSCYSAAEANQLLSESVFSTILVDVFLPDEGGIQFISGMREKKLNTPVVAITGSSEIDPARKALRLGVYDYLIKPIDRKLLVQVVQNAVLQDRLREEQETVEQQKQIYQEELEQVIRNRENELLETESKYRSLAEQHLVGIFIQQNGKIQYINKKFCSMFGCTSEVAVLQKSILNFIHADDQSKIRDYIKAKYDGEPVHQSVAYRIKTNNSEERFFEMWLDTVTFKGHAALEGLVLEITEEKLSKERQQRLEFELMNEHKLAAIGKVATGITHNLNTPIAIIQGNAELLELKYPDLDEVNKILSQTEKMTLLIQSIAKKGQLEQSTVPMSIDLNKLINSELDFLNANLFFKHHVEKEYDFTQDLPVINGIYSDFSQSFVHLVQNAIDAIYTSEVKKIKISTKFDSNYIFISIEDSGEGIKEELRDKVFLPFFTTKPNQITDSQNPDTPRGTGLGLTLSINLLKKYNAEILFKTEMGKGSIFTIKIPVLNDPN